MNDTPRSEPSAADKTGPLVSVIIPTRDRPALLRRAIESVYAQSHRPIEIVLVDNHATDPLAPPADAPDGVSFRTVRTERLENASRARNIGIDAASGDYVTFLDDDDFYRPEKLAAQVAHLEREPTADLSIMEYAALDGPNQEEIRCGIDALDDLTEILRWGPIHTSCPMVRAPILRRERFNEDLTKFTDLYLNYRLLRDYRAVLTPGVGSVYDRTDRGDRITSTNRLHKLTRARKNAKNWRIICEEFAGLIETSTTLRRTFYGRQSFYAGLSGRPREAARFALAALGAASIKK